MITAIAASKVLKASHLVNGSNTVQLIPVYFIEVKSEISDRTIREFRRTTERVGRGTYAGSCQSGQDACEAEESAGIDLGFGE
jgi:hypothetical protein